MLGTRSAGASQRGAEARPAATMVGTLSLIDPRWRVEIEAEALVRSDGDR
jgi:enamine deaminase RidA (YjgF/YER057c/UK114 family)